ncbi:MAG: hypothetical protein AM1032_000347 [Mycoplasmataceae bacterium]|nr:MAG: hypothetical protein AM1032_000347 [Mycoplasmataceae bacterium]
MTYLSFRVKNLELLKLRTSSKDPSIIIEVKNLEVYVKEGELLESIGSFGRLHALTRNIEKIIVKNELLNFLIFFRLDTNFKFIIRIDKSPEWMFAENSCIDLGRVYRLVMIKDPFYNEDLKEIKKLIENYKNKKLDWDWTKEELEIASKTIENNHQFKKYKKALNNQRIIDLQEEVEMLKREKDKQYLEIEKLIEEVELAKVNHEEYLDKSQNWHEQQLIQKDEESEYWKKKFESLEQKFNQLEIKYSELIEQN